MTDFLNIPNKTPTNDQDWSWRVTQVVNGIMRGKTNNTGSFTLDDGEGSTTITLPEGRLGEDTVILFVPTTANAATEFGAGTIYVSGRDVQNSRFTVTHVNNAQTDRTFNFVLVG